MALSIVTTSVSSGQYVTDFGSNANRTMITMVKITDSTAKITASFCF